MSLAFNLPTQRAPVFYQWKDETLLLFCHLQPKASRDELVGSHGDRLKIRITAPPTDGKANKHLCKFIARQFGVAQSAVTIMSGELGKHKTLCIEQPTKLPTHLTIEQP